MSKNVTISGVRDFNLSHIFECGQCFRWDREEDGSYTIQALDRVINLKVLSENPKEAASGNSKKVLAENLQDGEITLLINNCDKAEFDGVWHHYLDLDRDYGKIKNTLTANDDSGHMAAAAAYGYGMRLLQQERWETLISFIVSQNNNIARIKKCVASLCENFGKPIGVYRDKMRYTFPEPEVLAGCSLEELQICRLGYRAEYIRQTAVRITEDNEAWQRAAALGTEELSVYLRSLPGIGPKVANCITLFAFGRYDSFPIDVWVRKVMSRLYGLPENDTAAMAAFASDKFGDLSGFAQQYLFFYARENAKIVLKEAD